MIRLPRKSREKTPQEYMKLMNESYDLQLDILECFEDSNYINCRMVMRHMYGTRRRLSSRDRALEKRVKFALRKLSQRGLICKTNRCAGSYKLLIGDRQ